MPNPIVFVSHAAKDAAIATQFKEDVERRYLGLCTLFVSSSLDSLKAGDEWIQTIKRNLNDAAIMIGLLSPRAIQRSWVYFEFGAAWVRDIPVIPVCHSGLPRDKLPVPLSIFQALDLTDKDHLQHLYTQIAGAVGSRVPDANFVQMAKRYFDITEPFRIRVLVMDWMRQLSIWNPHLSRLYEQDHLIENVLIPANLEMPFLEFVREVEARQFLSVQHAGMGIGTRVGAQASIFRVSRGTKFGELQTLLKDD
jgi:hypothetical protein